MKTTHGTHLVGVVGPCGSGKSTLVSQLMEKGISARQISQEHSFAPSMWQKLTNPDILVYLHASYPVATRRRNLNWTEGEYNEQCRRLSHARSHASLIIQTDELTPLAVVGLVTLFYEDFMGSPT